jgi:hypothetical protein
VGREEHPEEKRSRMEKKFTALRVIGTVFKILAWISLLVGIVGAVLALVASITMSGQENLLGLDLGGPLAGIAAFIAITIAAILNFLALYAIAEAIYLALAIEENTRRTAYVVQQQYLQSGYAPPPPGPSYEEE